MFELFSSGSVFCFWVFKTWYFIGVTFCTASCTLCLSLLPWNIEYIVLYHHSPWRCSFVCLYQNSLFFLLLLLLLCWIFQGLIFIPHKRTSVSRVQTSRVCRHLQLISSEQSQSDTRAVWNLYIQYSFQTVSCVFSSSPAFFRPVTVSQLNTQAWNEDLLCVLFFFFTWEPKNYRHSIQILKHGVLTWC